MSESGTGEVTNIESPPIPESLFPVEAEYTRCVRELNRSAIVSLLPESESLGVVGIDGKEYPLPTPEELRDIFARNRELIERKVGQGFTSLQLTPLAVPLSFLIDRAQWAVNRHAKAGKIFQTKAKPSDPDIPVQVNTEEPVWTWNTLSGAFDGDNLVYFPDNYASRAHHGKTKKEVMQAPAVCAVPGWSIGLVEPHVLIPKSGQGKTVGDRRQLEAYSSPQDYLRFMAQPAYQGESGWTPEDFLTHFITRLDATNQVSHDWNDQSALWLTGSWLPEAGGVPNGNWSRGYGQLDLGADYAVIRFEHWGARSTVRLGS